MLKMTQYKNDKNVNQRTNGKIAKNNQSTTLERNPSIIPLTNSE